MAYVLGFFTADGSMLKNKRGGHFIGFQITDKGLLYAIRKALGSNHKITVRNRDENYKKSYRLQIGSKEFFSDLIKIGLTQAKSKTIKLPDIPDVFLADFLRGYFDGDGNIVSGVFKRKNRKSLQKYFRLRFTSGSRTILENIEERLKNLLGLNGSILFYGNAWRLGYSDKNSVRVCNFMYKEIREKKLIYLERKYRIFQKFISRQTAGVA